MTTYAEQLAAWEDACATVRNQRADAAALITDYFGQDWPAPIPRPREEWLAERHPMPPKPEPPKEETRTMYGDEYRRGPNGDLEVWEDASWRRSAWTWDSLNAHFTSTYLTPKRRGETGAVLSLRHGHVPEPGYVAPLTIEEAVTKERNPNLDALRERLYLIAKPPTDCPEAGPEYKARADGWKAAIDSISGSLGYLLAATNGLSIEAVVAKLPSAWGRWIQFDKQDRGDLLAALKAAGAR